MAWTGWMVRLHEAGEPVRHHFSETEAEAREVAGQWNAAKGCRAEYWRL